MNTSLDGVPKSHRFAYFEEIIKYLEKLEISEKI